MSNLSRNLSPYRLDPFRAPPSLRDALAASSAGSCEHPPGMREPKNPRIDGPASTNIAISPGGGRPGTNLSLAFDIFDQKMQEFEKDRMRWLEAQLSPDRPDGGAGNGPASVGSPLRIVSANALLSVSPSTAQTQTGDLITWTLTVAGTSAYYA